MSTSVSYTPGDWTAVAGARSWMLVHAAPDTAIVSSLWQQMDSADSVEALLAGLFAVGLEVLPDFSLLAEFGRSRHVICRGRGRAQLVRGDSQPVEQLDGDGLATWSERRLDGDVRRVVLGETPQESALRLPAASGVFLASAVTVEQVTAGRGPAAAPLQAVESPMLQTVVPAVGPDPIAAGSTEEVAPASIEAAVWVPAVDETLSYVSVDDGPGRAKPVPPVSVDASASDVLGDGADDGGYDFLFAATQSRTVEGAAVRPATDADVDDIPMASWQPPAVPVPVPAPVAVPPAPRGTPVEADELIDAVPWVAAEPAVPSPAAATPTAVHAAAPAPDAGDDGSTVKRSDVLKLAARAVAADRIGPTVHALLCPVSHANPPNSSFCRLCGAPLPQHDPVTIPRPVLGVLRLSTGDVIALDRGVVMGRSPRTDFDGDERPHVVKLPSADGEISRTHLQVTLDGWHVLVTDLKSTNGTLVTLPGRDPEQLRPNEALPIQPGTVVTLADGVDFRYEVAE